EIRREILAPNLLSAWVAHPEFSKGVIAAHDFFEDPGRATQCGDLSMSEPMQPVPVSVVPDTRPTEVVVISHSPLFYWWPVLAVGFLMAAISFWRDERIA